MYAFHPVFIQLFHDQADAVLCVDFIVYLGKPVVEKFNNKTAQGIIVFRFQRSSQMVIYIIQVKGTFYDIFIVRNLPVLSEYVSSDFSGG